MPDKKRDVFEELKEELKISRINKKRRFLKRLLFVVILFLLFLILFIKSLL